MSKIDYEKPALQYWQASQLDEVEASMSVGGGSPPVQGVVYLLNNVDGLSSIGNYGILGHAAMMIKKSGSSYCTLYNFGPDDNSSAFSEGAVGWFSEGDMTFSTFSSKCREGGVLINNGVASIWREGFDRYIKIVCAQNICDKMCSYANGKVRNPNRYNAVSYNCLSFVTDVLSYGGITIYDSAGADLSAYLIPNTFFDSASRSSLGTLCSAQYI